MTTVIFLDWDCQVVFAKYSNGRTAIQLLDALTYEPIAMASVNLPDEPLASDEICIKNYSENEGILEVLVKAKIVSAPLRYIQNGWVDIPVCHLLANKGEAK